MKKVLTLLAATTALSACNFDQVTNNKAITEEQVKLIIDNYIEENPGKILQEVNNYMAKMQAQQEIQAQEDMFKNPINITLDKETPVKGPENAPITIIEFSDFECPFCQRALSTVYSVLAKYEGKIKLAYKQLPLPFHEHAKPAALASIAANNQGKFWEFHDELFKNQQNLNEETYLRIAKNLGLDIEKFKTDMASTAAETKLELDMKQAQDLGISGTPHFLINGVTLSGAQPEEEFVKVIEKLLDDMNK